MVLILVILSLSLSINAQSNDDLAQVKRKAEKGDAEAQVRLGVCYEAGVRVEQDLPEALKWFRKAAEQGYAPAQIILGHHYANGIGIAKDEVEAVKCYRKAAEQGHTEAQARLGVCYEDGNGVKQDLQEALKWFRKAAEQGDYRTQYLLGFRYAKGLGVVKDYKESFKWLQMAAYQGHDESQYCIGSFYQHGNGVEKDSAEAVKWYEKSADQGHAKAQFNLYKAYDSGEGVEKCSQKAVKWLLKSAKQGNSRAQFTIGMEYFNGNNIIKNDVEAYTWLLLAAASEEEETANLAQNNLKIIEQQLSRHEITRGQELARTFKPEKKENEASEAQAPANNGGVPTATGTGFFITPQGHLITNWHVIKAGRRFEILTNNGSVAAELVKKDESNDLALLKVQGEFTAFAITSSRKTKLGASVATIGFPNVGIQGFAPKYAKGEIASLSGFSDDSGYFQISVPTQPGNSGGALFDELGNVVGVVSAKLNASSTLKASGSLPENVNYAIKSSFLLGFLESIPQVNELLVDPATSSRKTEDVLDDAQKASALVIVY